MNLLDENLPSEQCDVLRAWGIRCRILGRELARRGLGDDDIVALLHRLKQPTLFTRDRHFFEKRLCHRRYALVWLDLAPEESALFIRRFLLHPRFRTKARRMGVVARVHHDGVHFWPHHPSGLRMVAWSG